MYGEMVDLDKSDKMIKISGKWINQTMGSLFHLFYHIHVCMSQ